MKILNHLIAMLADEATKETLREERGDSPYGLRDLATVVRQHFRNFTLHNPLGFLAGLIFTGTLFFPWWHSKVYEGYYTINAYAFTLWHNLPPEGLPYIIETPVIAVIVLILLLVGYLFLAFWGSTMAGKKGKLYLLGTGIFMLMYAAGFYGALLFATNRIGQPVTGYSSIAYSVEVDIYMTFTRAYLTAIAAGVVCMVSSLIHGRLKLKLHRKITTEDDRL